MASFIELLAAADKSAKKSSSFSSVGQLNNGEHHLTSSKIPILKRVESASIASTSDTRCVLMLETEGKNGAFTFFPNAGSLTSLSLAQVSFNAADDRLITLIVPGKATLNLDSCIFDITPEQSFQVIVQGKLILSNCTLGNVAISIEPTGAIEAVKTQFSAAYKKPNSICISSTGGNVKLSGCTFDGFNTAVQCEKESSNEIDLQGSKCDIRQSEFKNCAIGICAVEIGATLFKVKMDSIKEAAIRFVGNRSLNIVEMEDRQVVFGEVNLEGYSITGCASLSIDACEFMNISTGIDVQNALVIASNIILKSIKESGIRLSNCTGEIEKVKIFSGPQGSGISCSGQSSLNISEVLAQGFDNGFYLVGTRKVFCNYKIANCSFVMNNIGLNIVNARVNCGGSTFVNNNKFSRAIEVDEEELKRVHLATEPFLKFWFNNYVESKEGVRESNNDMVERKCPEDKPFKASSDFEFVMWGDALYERLMRSYKQIEYEKGKADEGYIGMQSVRSIIILVPRIKEILIKMLQEQLRLGLFVSLTPIRGASLISLDELLESWMTLRSPSFYDEAQEIIDELNAKKLITSEKYVDLVINLRANRTNCFLKATHPKKLDYLKTLAMSNPLEAFIFAKTMTNTRFYNSLETPQGKRLFDENTHIQQEILLFLAKMTTSPLQATNIDVSWVNQFAVEELVNLFQFNKTYNFQENENFLTWCQCCFQAGTEALVVTKLSSNQADTKERSAREFYKIYAQALMPVLKGKAPVDTVADSVNFFSRDFLAHGAVPLPLKFLVAGCVDVEKAMERVTYTSSEVNARQELIDALILFGFREMEALEFKNIEDTFCGACHEFVIASEVAWLSDCDDPGHRYCKKCFKQLLQLVPTGKTDEKALYGLCPGVTCGKYCSRRDMVLAEIDSDAISRFIRFTINRQIAKTKKVWHKCALSTCSGGTSVSEGDQYFICKLCGMFGTIGSSTIDVGHLFSIDKTLIHLLLMCFKYSVNGSNHVHHYFPYGHGGNLFLNNRSQPDTAKLKLIVGLIPDEIKDYNKIKDPICYSLMNWVIISNPAQFRLLSKPPEITSVVKNNINTRVGLGGPSGGFDTSAVYWLQIQHSQEEEITFQRAKAKSGSFWAWHGSGVQNWHNILRAGLKNMSNSKYQINGAAYGAGIYCSPDFNTAAGYSRGYGVYTGNRTQDNFRVIALIEVVDKDIKRNGTIYVIPSEDYVQMRYVCMGNIGNGY